VADGGGAGDRLFLSARSLTAAKQRYDRDIARKAAKARTAQNTLKAHPMATESVIQQLAKAKFENRKLQSEIAAKQEELDLEKLIGKGYLLHVQPRR
jgi:hypothetical protein